MLESIKEVSNGPTDIKQLILYLSSAMKPTLHTIETNCEGDHQYVQQEEKRDLPS